MLSIDTTNRRLRKYLKYATFKTTTRLNVKGAKQPIRKDKFQQRRKNPYKYQAACRFLYARKPVQRQSRIPASCSIWRGQRTRRTMLTLGKILFTHIDIGLTAFRLSRRSRSRRTASRFVDILKIALSRRRKEEQTRLGGVH